jgi:phage N-6-adenine-methyltransferase
MSDNSDLPPRPAEIIPEHSDLQMAYQAMTPLPAEKYRQLAEHIRENGVEDPIKVDEDGRIIDGHHREAIAQHYDLEGEKAPEYRTNGELETDAEKIAAGIKRNNLGRDTDDHVKSQSVADYIKRTWDRTDRGEWIQQENQATLAEKLGVSRPLVSEVLDYVNGNIIKHARARARQYYRDNPDASYREVARHVDASNSAVTRWIKQDFESDAEADADGDDVADDTEPQNETAADGSGEVLSGQSEPTNPIDEQTATPESVTTDPFDISDDDTDADDAASAENSHDLDVLTSDESDEWSSPRELVEPLDAAVSGFDLDPCSGAESSPFAAETYTEADNGLAQPWHGDVWVNPPYSEMWDWTDKAIEAVTAGGAESVCFLCKGDSSTDWWQCAAMHATVICAIDHRLSFGDGENSAPFASHVVVFGELTPDLEAELREHGTLLRPEVDQ